MFSATSVVWCFDHVAPTVAGLIRLEMIEWLRTAWGQRAVVPMMRIEAVTIYFECVGSCGQNQPGHFYRPTECEGCFFLSH